MSDHPKPPPTVQRINNSGLVEIVDIHTGKVLCIQPTPNDDYLHNRFENLVKIDTPDGPVYIERHLDPNRVLKKHSRQSHPQFSLAWAELVVAELLTPIYSRAKLTQLHQDDSTQKLTMPAPDRAMTLTQAVRKLELPMPLFTKWRNISEEFNSIIDSGLQAQAQLLQDEALTTARQTTRKDDVPVASLQIDTLMKQAKSADSGRFGDKQKLDVTTKAVHTIVVETGIRRRSNPESLLPPGFEEAIRDATPINERKAEVRGSSGDDRAIEAEASPGSQALWEVPQAFPKEEARAPVTTDRDPWSTSEPAPLPRFQDNQTPSRPPSRSLLEDARNALVDTESRPIPDLEDSEF